MRRSLDDNQIGARGNRNQRGAHFRDGSERVARAVNEQRRRPQLIKVRRAKPVRFARRMQRVGEQHQSICQTRVLGRGHSCLAPSIGMAPEKHPPGCKLPQRFCRASDAFAIARRLRRVRRSTAPFLPVREIEAQNQRPRLRKSLGDGFDQRRLAIRPGAMRDRQRIA